MKELSESIPPLAEVHIIRRQPINEIDNDKMSTIHNRKYNRDYVFDSFDNASSSKSLKTTVLEST